ncbi:NAK protein kinase Ppk13 [Schizosaccharomyces cryophilus OY26]|uniref:non-specific serine/threonine protein kinase n=1 Tax=Schizosaccharomyces cryophilus (strain OY26 / ATCC MYA-4695 / CBS 11777 / NBRC 106824 / NRRL Y48691) TaxID=653667 RepID=S9W2R6_SCHCR|nr:NAK protein kinase Ppk13 [Schizosaccharomyces cryophilus OY26]EPY52829.1 NAK protein kinase Ppk13 [Schizosaccharomyces cryophilus OY26]
MALCKVAFIEYLTRCHLNEGKFGTPLEYKKMQSFLKNTWNSINPLISSLLNNELIVLKDEQYKVLQLLGEGGYAFVYLVENVNSGEKFALKKIKCHSGREGVQKALIEAKFHEEFNHANLLKSIHVQLQKEVDGVQYVYIMFPFFQKGTVAQIVQSQHKKNTFIPKRIILSWSLCLLQALKYLHNGGEDSASEDAVDTTNLIDLQLENKPMKKKRTNSYLHGDVKPENLLLSDDMRNAVLTDFGSICRIPSIISNNSEAISFEDKASENCTMPYRAPELFHVRPGSIITEKADIWSFGCTLYTIMFGYTPFEKQVSQGGSLALAVCNAQYSFPSENPYEPRLSNLVCACLQLNPEQRPYADDLIHAIKGIMNG